MDIGSSSSGSGIASAAVRGQRLRGLLRPILTDFPFRDLGSDSSTQQAVEVLASHGDGPPRGTPIRELQNPETGEHLLTVDEGVDGLHWHFDGLGDFWVDPTGWFARYAIEDGASLSDAES